MNIDGTLTASERQAPFLIGTVYQGPLSRRTRYQVWTDDAAGTIWAVDWRTQSAIPLCEIADPDWQDAVANDARETSDEAAA